MTNEFKFKVPRLYKAVTRVVKLVKEEGSDPTELVNQYSKKTNIKALSALVKRVLESGEVVEKVMENSEILKKEKAADPWLFRVLITELLLGKKRLPVGCKPIQTVLAYGPKLKVELRKLKKRKNPGGSSENSSDSDVSDDDLSGEEEVPSEKKMKNEEAEVPPKKKMKKEEAEEEHEPRQNKKKRRGRKRGKRVSTGQAEATKEHDSNIMKEDLSTAKKIVSKEQNEWKSPSQKHEDFISVKPKDIKAKIGRNLMLPKPKKFITPKLKKLHRIREIAKKAHSQESNRIKRKPRYFEVPSSV